MKKTLAFVLAFAMLMALLAPVGTVTAATAITQSTFQTKLTEFRNTKYANDSTYQNDSGCGGSQCFGYANCVAKYIFGSFPSSSSSGSNPNANWTITHGAAAVTNLHIGDIVRRYSSATSSHSIFITGISGDTVYYTDANSDWKNTVKWDRTVSKSTLANQVEQYLGSDSAANTKGWVAHYNGWIDVGIPTCSVTAIGQSVQVSWNATANATSYDVYLLQSPWGWEDIKYHAQVSASSTSYMFNGVTPGDYAAFVIARPNPDQGAQSNWVHFTSASYTPGKPSVTVSVGNEYEDTVFEFVNGANTDWNEYYLYDASGNQIKFDGFVYFSACGILLKPGKYQVKPVAVNKKLYDGHGSYATFGDVVTFTVPAGGSIQVVGSGTCEGRRYEVISNKLTWLEAQAYCESVGGHLVSITSQNENDFVRGLFPEASTDSYWIGLHDYTTECVFEWIDGSVFSYSNWAEGEPNDSNGVEDVVRIYHSGSWNDTYDKISRGFICEYECTHATTEIRGASASTCTKAGYSGDVYCADCEKLLETGHTLPLADHQYIAVVTAPTCTEQGYTTHTCSGCGDSYVDTYVDPLDHDMKVTTVPATPEAQGYDLHKCQREGCDYSFKDNYTTYVAPVVVSEDDPQIVLGTVRERAGEEATLQVTLKNADTLKSIGLSNITYDTKALELVGGTWMLSGGVLASVKAEDRAAAIAFGGNTDCNGLVLELKFLVKENTADGDYAVSASVTSKRVVNNAEVFYDLASVPGAVSVISVIEGDVDGDDDVDSDDAIHLLYYTLMPDLYPINQDGDFDGDGDTDSDDAIYLLYYTLMPELYPLK